MLPNQKGKKHVFGQNKTFHFDCVRVLVLFYFFFLIHFKAVFKPNVCFELKSLNLLTFAEFFSPAQSNYVLWCGQICIFFSTKKNVLAEKFHSVLILSRHNMQHQEMYLSALMVLSPIGSPRPPQAVISFSPQQLMVIATDRESSLHMGNEQQEQAAKVRNTCKESALTNEEKGRGGGIYR
ncbi:hypothetical protein DR999_PMT15589 [Platysternon megacephalum]|uniref:Uncharacterized protein n=1 Tax=Platysternon megacephalum TaxID=55544 RepID=A0A4D9E4Z4_9SAUR|nr:hypothetical protein DR999_PMT15589 [Platysternon megacephalum]